jgi:hypothetical protein
VWADRTQRDADGFYTTDRATGRASPAITRRIDLGSSDHDSPVDLGRVGTSASAPSADSRVRVRRTPDR